MEPFLVQVASFVTVPEYECSWEILIVPVTFLFIYSHIFM